MTDFVKAVARARLAREGWEEDDSRWDGLLADYKRDFCDALADIEAAGYRVVPVEVTDDMEVAANEMLHDWVCAQQCWDAILAAAPKVTP